MAEPLLTDELWAVIRPLLPPERPKPKGGRPQVDDRKTLTGVLFVLKTGIPWEYLPQEMGCGSGMTCWRRVRDWQRAGVWRNLHRVLLTKLHRAGEIDWSRVAVDTQSVPAPHAPKKGAQASARTRRKGTGCHTARRTGASKARSAASLSRTSTDCRSQ